MLLRLLSIVFLLICGRHVRYRVLQAKAGCVVTVCFEIFAPLRSKLAKLTHMVANKHLAVFCLHAVMLYRIDEEKYDQGAQYRQS